MAIAVEEMSAQQMWRIYGIHQIEVHNLERSLACGKGSPAKQERQRRHLERLRKVIIRREKKALGIPE